MLVWLKFLFGQSSRLLVLLLVLMSMLSLTGCGTTPLSLLTGGGTNVAANTQVGKQNNQTLGSSTVQEFGETTVQAEKVTNTQNQTTRVSANDVQTVVVNEVPSWIILLLVLGWLFPSPNEIGRWMTNLFRRKNK